MESTGLDNQALMEKLDALMPTIDAMRDGATAMQKKLTEAQRQQTVVSPHALLEMSKPIAQAAKVIGEAADGLDKCSAAVDNGVPDGCTTVRRLTRETMASLSAAGAASPGQYGASLQKIAELLSALDGLQSGISLASTMLQLAVLC